VAIVSHGAAYFHWTEKGVDNKASNHVAGKVRRLGPIWKLIGFSNLEFSNEVDGAAQQRRKRLQCPDIASLKEEVLVGEQFVLAVCSPSSRSAQIEGGNSGLKAIAGPTVRVQENGGRLIDLEEVLNTQLGERKSLGSAWVRIVVFGEKLNTFPLAGNDRLVQGSESIVKADITGSELNAGQTQGTWNMQEWART